MYLQVNIMTTAIVSVSDTDYTNWWQRDSQILLRLSYSNNYLGTLQIHNRVQLIIVLLTPRVLHIRIRHDVCSKIVNPDNSDDNDDLWKITRSIYSIQNVKQ